jgi:aminoglycoside 6'-N-acetyltransferase I
MHIRPIQPEDSPEWHRMRTALWPDQTEADMRAWSGRDDAITLVAQRENGSLCGFVEVGTRAFADGCSSSPVAYLEGWYVDADCRRAGVGRDLIRTAEEWALARGLSELASDADLANSVSQSAHAALGFSEIGRAVLYAKRVHPPGAIVK